MKAGVIKTTCKPLSYWLFHNQHYYKSQHPSSFHHKQQPIPQPSILHRSSASILLYGLHNKNVQKVFKLKYMNPAVILPLQQDE